MKDILHTALTYLVIALLGAFVGYGIASTRKDADVILKDTHTEETHHVKSYGGLELAAATIRLDVPQIKGMKRFFLLPIENTDTVTIEKVRYISLPRESFYTNKGDVEIWHSGVDSTIDSLSYLAKVETTINRYAKASMNVMRLGIEASYAGMLGTPVYLEYERKALPWLSAYARGEYDVLSRKPGGRIGARMSFEW